MTGPTIRNFELARAVAAAGVEVTLAVPGDPERAGDGFDVRGYSNRGLAPLVTAHDTVLVSGYLAHHHPELLGARHLAVDLYDPFPLENLHLRDAQPEPDQHSASAFDRAVLTSTIQRGDVFLCASERQRDYWLGWLTMAGRVNPAVHRADPGFTALLRLVPFGLPEAPPQPGPPRFRGVVPGIGPGDFVVIWGGGIWNWFDPLTLIRAGAAARHRLPSLRVLFPAVNSPSPEVGPMAMAERAVRLAQELEVEGSTVFFGSGWVPYEERGQMLLEADVGASLHRDDVETRFSFRTRVLDYLWAGLPILATEGDSMADLVQARDLGAVVGYGDVDAVTAALIELGTSPERRSACALRSREAAARYTWREVATPLVEYCRDPRPAPDRGRTMPVLSWPEPSRAGLVERVQATLREEGVPGVARKVVRRATGRRRGRS